MVNEPDCVARCTSCKKHVLGIKHGEDHVSDNPPERILLLSCPECFTHFLLHYQGQQITTDLISWEAPRYLYPKDETGVHYPVPETLVDSYGEAHRAFHWYQEYRLAAIACRRTLDLLCREKGVGNGTLQKKLERLNDQRLLDPR